MENQLHHECTNDILLENSRCDPVRRSISICTHFWEDSQKVMNQYTTSKSILDGTSQIMLCRLCLRMKGHIRIGIPAAKARSEGPQWKASRVLETACADETRIDLAQVRYCNRSSQNVTLRPDLHDSSQGRKRRSVGFSEWRSPAKLIQMYL
jgi:hypothetical protein